MPLGDHVPHGHAVSAAAADLKARLKGIRSANCGVGRRPRTFAAIRARPSFTP